MKYNYHIIKLFIRGISYPGTEISYQDFCYHSYIFPAINVNDKLYVHVSI
jgi:hypothetical protein